MSRLHDHKTGKVKRDDEKKKRDAVIEEQKKFESMMEGRKDINQQHMATMGGVFDLLLKAQNERRRQE